MRIAKAEKEQSFFVPSSRWGCIRVRQRNSK
jgi:hypothetical protein